jgi:uncharacterized protein with PIN domain
VQRVGRQMAALSLFPFSPRRNFDRFDHFGKGCYQASLSSADYFAHACAQVLDLPLLLIPFA